MKKFTYNSIIDENCIGIITILDYEISVTRTLSDIKFTTQNKTQKKILIDLVLKVGLNEYRFVIYNVSENGKILWNSGKYITPCEKIVKFANSIIKQESNILSNSMLSNSAQAMLLKNC
ncbi:type II toxin-antitoxin system RnlB family antitoxin [Campylobacter lari]|uniref:type II toxin-antitoxin system RnlB family antitoxin n=1 Tax=Campylobacter TaxID=194 RepID=UPI0021532793|nr:type II toxin-antitoxin system RnlB family antitoxin [Campylobacter lari]MCR6511435.1 type II toxin-antitoxin system RnlB family antitoxin [Campylobacter lari]MCR6513023.1 type II toxin-antitoxin system RnlB family antitoxin [Campylobacter lari]MCV3419166.1 type II toxin-antitoxin system RnlB family antitoxin [Campylobacter lari]MCV3422317.1 type II toxin-antitoxin system RnlB family antitoxin [Campylobacter lari]MCV3498469.1 type II toxin-antitoxin system RnlB family antitoxin [Campylobact